MAARDVAQLYPPAPEGKLGEHVRLVISRQTGGRTLWQELYPVYSA